MKYEGMHAITAEKLKRNATTYMCTGHARVPNNTKVRDLGTPSSLAVIIGTAQRGKVSRLPGCSVVATSMWWILSDGPYCFMHPSFCSTGRFARI